MYRADDHIHADLLAAAALFVIDAAVDVDEEFAAVLAAQVGDLLQALHAAFQEGLAGKAGLHGHQRDHIDILDERLDMVDALAGVDEYARLHARGADLIDGAAHEAGGVGMEGDIVRPRVRQAAHVAGRIGHHDVYVHDDLGIVFLQFLDQFDGHAEVGHVVAVHQVDVEHGRAAGDELIEFFLHVQEAAVDDRRGIEHIVPPLSSCRSQAVAPPSQTRFSPVI